jgi:hypothetical protein
MPNKCTETNKAVKAAKDLEAAQKVKYANFVKAIKEKGFGGALTAGSIETGLKQKKGAAFMNEVYLFGKSGKPVPPRVWVWSYSNGDAEIEAIADHRGH